MPRRSRFVDRFRQVAGLLLALAASAAPMAAGAGAPASTVLSLRQLASPEGLPQLTVFALASDREGYVYAGTQDGLSRWDGRRFEAVPLVDGQRDWVTHLLADDARLWIGTDNSGLQWHAGGEVAEVRAPDGARLPAIEALLRTRRGELLAGTPQGLFECTIAGCTALAGSSGLEVAELHEDAAGRVWVGTNVDGLYRFERAADGALRRSDFHLGRAHGLPNDAVRALLETGDGRLWIGTGRGLARWDGRALKRWTRVGDGPLGGIFALRALPDGEVLAATWGNGLARFRADDGFEALGLAAGMPDAYVHTLLLGGDAAAPIVWAGTGSGGVLRIEPGRWRSHDERHGLPQRVVVGVGEMRAADGTRTLWAGTLGGAAHWRDGRWQPLLPPQYADRIVYDALQDPSGRRWYATHRGLLQDDRGHWREWESERSSIPATSVDQLAWVDGRLWLATGHGLAALDDRGIDLMFDDQPDPRRVVARALLPLRGDGARPRVLLVTANRVLLTDGESLRDAGDGCAIPGSYFDADRLADGEIWLATRDGAMRLDLEAEHPACVAVREPADTRSTVYEIAEDAQGRIYLFGYDGARRIDEPDAAELVEGRNYRRFGLDDGLPSLEFNRDALVDADGRLWAANAAGLVSFDPTAAIEAPATAPLRMSVRSGGHALAAGTRLPADHGDVEFAPRLLSFRHEHRIRYRTRLIGLEPEPGAWTADGDRRYPRLPPGHYRFTVSARDAGGREHGPLEFAFEVAAPWWRQPLALVAIAIVLLGAGLAAGRVRAHALARRAAQLEALVGERTRALERASNSDPLTGAWNRRYFHARVGDWLRASGQSQGLLLMLIDIDHFKAINDRHGHAIGDAVLVEVAARLREAGGADAELIRWGGEEFLLTLRECAPESADARVATLLEAVSARPVLTDGVQVSLTCSIGYTRCRPPADGIDNHIDLVVQRADAALYRAKAEGRNRAVEA